jgi:hypothetical protein
MEPGDKCRKKNLITLIILFSLLLTACNTRELLNSKTTVIKQIAPEISTIDLSSFKASDCTWQSEDYAVCNENGTFKKMGCTTLSNPDPYLNLLDPQVSIIECNYLPDIAQEDNQTEDGVFNNGCSRPMLVRYIVYSDGNYQLIRNLVDLSQYFAPIESPEEALAYAIAATGYQSLYNFTPPPEYRFLLDNIEETTINNTNDGYIVALYHHQFCGCGPHITFLTKVRVNFDGTINLLDPVPAFEDPAEDGLCVD